MQLVQCHIHHQNELVILSVVEQLDNSIAAESKTCLVVKLSDAPVT